MQVSGEEVVIVRHAGDDFVPVVRHDGQCSRLPFVAGGERKRVVGKSYNSRIR